MHLLGRKRKNNNKTNSKKANPQLEKNSHAEASEAKRPPRSRTVEEREKRPSTSPFSRGLRNVVRLAAVNSASRRNIRNALLNLPREPVNTQDRLARLCTCDLRVLLCTLSCIRTRLQLKTHTGPCSDLRTLASTSWCCPFIVFKRLKKCWCLVCRSPPPAHTYPEVANYEAFVHLGEAALSPADAL